MITCVGHLMITLSPHYILITVARLLACMLRTSSMSGSSAARPVFVMPYRLPSLLTATCTEALQQASSVSVRSARHAVPTCA
jgi:hypothetical protein